MIKLWNTPIQLDLNGPHRINKGTLPVQDDNIIQVRQGTSLSLVMPGQKLRYAIDRPDDDNEYYCAGPEDKGYRIWPEFKEPILLDRSCTIEFCADTSADGLSKDKWGRYGRRIEFQVIPFALYKDLSEYNAVLNRMKSVEPVKSWAVKMAMGGQHTQHSLGRLQEPDRIADYPDFPATSAALIWLAKGMTTTLNDTAKFYMLRSPLGCDDLNWIGYDFNNVPTPCGSMAGTALNAWYYAGKQAVDLALAYDLLRFNLTDEEERRMRFDMYDFLNAVSAVMNGQTKLKGTMWPIAGEVAAWLMTSALDNKDEVEIDPEYIQSQFTKEDPVRFGDKVSYAFPAQMGWVYQLAANWIRRKQPELWDQLPRMQAFFRNCIGGTCSGTKKDSEYPGPCMIPLITMRNSCFPEYIEGIDKQFAGPFTLDKQAFKIAGVLPIMLYDSEAKG